MYILLPRHLSTYCGEDQKFELNMSTIQDIGTPVVYNTESVDDVLRSMLMLYFSHTTTDSMLKTFTEQKYCAADNAVLMCEPINGKSRYTLLFKVDKFIIECIDCELVIPSFTVIMAEVYEV